MSEDQYGLRKSRETREAVIALCIIELFTLGMLKKNKLTWTKLFKDANWNKLFVLLINIGLKYRDRWIIGNKYRDQMAATRIDECENEAIIKKGARKGCSLYPPLFNSFIELRCMPYNAPRKQAEQE